tara:strand:- start:1348 stop:1596 length:249 start_codon:yes stop_codon:yes gene_type:complete
MGKNTVNVSFLNIKNSEVLALCAQAIKAPKCKQVRLSHFVKYEDKRPGLKAIGFDSLTVVDIFLPKPIKQNLNKVQQMALFV